MKESDLTPRELEYVTKYHPTSYAYRYPAEMLSPKYWQTRMESNRSMIDYHEKELKSRREDLRICEETLKGINERETHIGV